jgi:6-phosphofructokinase 1
MAGRTACLVGLVNHRLVHVPIALAAAHRNRVRPESPLWRDVIDTTGQRVLRNADDFDRADGDPASGWQQPARAAMAGS